MRPLLYLRQVACMLVVGGAVASSRGQDAENPPERMIDDAFSQLGSPSERWMSRTDYPVGIQRWSLSRGSFEIAMSLNAARTLGAGEERSGLLVRRPPAFSVGLQDKVGYETTTGSLLSRSTELREGDAPLRRMGFEWTPAPSRVSFARDGFGIRLQGNQKVTMRLRHGMVTVYAQRAF